LIPELTGVDVGDTTDLSTVDTDCAIDESIKSIVDSTDTVDSAIDSIDCVVDCTIKVDDIAGIIDGNDCDIDGIAGDDNGTAVVEENTGGDVICCVDGTDTVDDVGDTIWQGMWLTNRM